MKNILIELLTGGALFVGGFLISTRLFKKRKLFNFDKKVKEAQDLIEKNKKEAQEILTTARLRIKQLKENQKNNIAKREERFRKTKENLRFKEEMVRKKGARNNDIRLKIASLKEETQTIQNNINRTERDNIESLTKKTGLTKEDVKNGIIKSYVSELKQDNEEKIISMEETIKEDAVKIAKKILINTIQRLSSPTSVESRVLLIPVPKDHIKGKIVGKEGKNIEIIENALEVDVVFNDMPNTISVSCYNLINRRTAQITIEKLIKVRNEINENVINQKLTEVKEILDKELFEIGSKFVSKIGLKIVDKELVKTIGRLQFRTSYGQNIMKHSLEVGWAATMMGSELGLDVNVCRVAGFLHDLGKAIDQNPDVQGTHDFLTKELMEKYNFNEAEIHAAWTHHESEPQKTPEALIVRAADAISAGRPGARQESIEKYVKRLKELEETAGSFEGVKKTFAISAGREIRVIVNSETLKDKGLQPLANDIAKKIENNLNYPGKIKVNVIRRTRHTEIAQ